MAEQLRDDYAADHFAGKRAADNPPECDLVMKGGITSGIVYPYAIMELAGKYRFRSIGGTSAGAIAAAFTAAAEYARQSGDDAGFLRLKARAELLPSIMLSLFQPSRPLAGLMNFLLRALPGGVGGFILWAPLSFWLSSLIGIGLGGGLLWLLGGGWAGAVLGALIGLIIALAVRIGLMVKNDIPKNGFGICTGLRQPGARVPALTDWIYESLQEIAFGDAKAAKPLTFGDLWSAGQAERPVSPVIELRAVTTDLSMGRPRSLPELDEGFRFEPPAWARLFPAPVMTYLLGLDSSTVDPASDDNLPKFPGPDDLPVIIAVRMSLSFPFLFTTVPTKFRDIGLYMMAKDQIGTIDPIDIPDPKIRIRDVLFTDGGLTSNFPITFFDSLLPRRPTFALSLDNLDPGMKPDKGRVYLPHGAAGGAFWAIDAIKDLGAFVGAIMQVPRGWQDQMMSTMGAQRERVARVYLDPATEGGLNLGMPAALSRKLMGYGQVAGRKIVAEFDFDEHRWRRALVAYEKLERELEITHQTWNEAGYGAWFEEYLPDVESYREVTLAQRHQIHARLGALAATAKKFDPPIPGKDKHFPRPPGSLRIAPKI